MTPLERYNAYKASKGLSETAETVTKPQNYNVRSGGVSASERKTLEDIRAQQAETREANRIQSEKFWKITTAKKEDVPKIILSQPDAPNTSKGNLAEFIESENIDIDNAPTGWDKVFKQTELREKLREETQAEIIEPPPYVAINQPQESRASPRGASPQIVIETPQNYTQQDAIGRIETPEPLQNSVLPEEVPEQVPDQSKTISEILNSTPKENLFPTTFDYLKIPLAITALAIVGFFVIRRMKK